MTKKNYIFRAKALHMTPKKNYIFKERKIIINKDNDVMVITKSWS